MGAHTTCSMEGASPLTTTTPGLGTPRQAGLRCSSQQAATRISTSTRTLVRWQQATHLLRHNQLLKPARPAITEPRGHPAQAKGGRWRAMQLQSQRRQL